MVQKSCFLQHAIAGRADKLEDLISFQTCHRGTRGRAVNSGEKILGGVSSGQQKPRAQGARLCSSSDWGKN